MADDKKFPYIDSDREDDDSGTGAQGSGIEFVDFLKSPASQRDDLLSDQDKRHLLAIHKDVHESKVKSQKDKIQQYKNLKEGKMSLDAFRAGMGSGGGGNPQFKDNPRLKNFRGRDPQVIGLPNELNTDANPEQQNELQNELKLRLGMQPTPKFNPKPHGPY